MSAVLEDRAQAAQRLAGDLKAQGVETVMITWIDNSGIARAKAVPIDLFERAARWGIGLSPVFHVFLANDQITSSPDIGGPSGDLRLVPDPVATRPIASMPGWAWAPADQFTQEAEPFPACQRSFLRRMVERARLAGLEFKMSFEVEWFLARSKEDRFAPLHDGPAVSARALTYVAPFARQLLHGLSTAGLQPEAVNAEYGSGQMEVSIAPGDPIGAADASVLVRQIIHGLAATQDLEASFAPVFGGEAGNGGHLHLSVWSHGRNLFQGGTEINALTKVGAHFLAGVLRELPALAAVGAPVAASYLRLRPSMWAGAYSCWGLENREAAVRLVMGMHGNRARAANVEIKCFDETSNPYLLVGSLIAAGLRGVHEELDLPPEVLDDPAKLPESEIQRRGIERLPSSLTEAATRLEGSEVLQDAMGPELFGAVLAVRHAEAEWSAGKSDQEVMQCYLWRY